jgi:hypothetical protein
MIYSLQGKRFVIKKVYINFKLNDGCSYSVSREYYSNVSNIELFLLSHSLSFSGTRRARAFRTNE